MDFLFYQFYKGLGRDRAQEYAASRTAAGFVFPLLLLFAALFWLVNVVGWPRFLAHQFIWFYIFLDLQLSLTGYFIIWAYYAHHDRWRRVLAKYEPPQPDQ